MSHLHLAGGNLEEVVGRAISVCGAFQQAHSLMCSVDHIERPAHSVPGVGKSEFVLLCAPDVKHVLKKLQRLRKASLLDARRGQSIGCSGNVGRRTYGSEGQACPLKNVPGRSEVTCLPFKFSKRKSGLPLSPPVVLRCVQVQR